MYNPTTVTKGTLEVICGPMFSGKSEELIRRLRRAKIAQQNVITFKPNIDNRYLADSVVSHDGTTLEANPIASPDDMLNIISKLDIAVIGIDEVQFFPTEIIATICHLVEHGKRVVVSGLDLDFRGVPFGCMPVLLAIADSITKLRAICCVCARDAHYTQRLVNGFPASYDDPIILVGAKESYQARCRNCFMIDKLHYAMKEIHI
jgi:thymidine kinase